MRFFNNQIDPIKFEWDKGNKEKNWEKHNISFQECEEVFFNDPTKIFKDVSHSQKENRFIILGVTNEKKKLFISFTIRTNKIRVISARSQSVKERVIYEK